MVTAVAERRAWISIDLFFARVEARTAADELRRAPPREQHLCSWPGCRLRRPSLQAIVLHESSHALLESA